MIKLSLPESPGNSPGTLLFRLGRDFLNANFWVLPLENQTAFITACPFQPRLRTCLEKVRRMCQKWASCTVKKGFLAKETAYWKSWTVG